MSLQPLTPRNNSHIALRKSVHFLFCCFKASILAHPLVQCCNKVGKAPSHTNDCCILAAQTGAALVGFGANSSILTAGLFLSQCCLLLVTPKQPPPSAAEKILNRGELNKMHVSIHSYSDEGIMRQLVRMCKSSLKAILSRIPCSFDVPPSEIGSQKTVFLPFKLIKTPLIYWPVL